LNTKTLPHLASTAPTNGHEPYFVAQAGVTARPARIKVPACFRGDTPLPADDPDAKTEAIGYALVAADEKAPALRALSQAWLDVASFHPAATRQAAELVAQNLTAVASALQAAEQPMECTNLAYVTGITSRLAAGIVNAARIAADPRLSDPERRVTPPDADDWFRYMHEAEVMDAASSDGVGGDVGIPQDAFHQRRLLALVQSYAQVWGVGHGRTVKAEYAAQLADAAAFLAAEAVTASLDGLETNPHDVSKRLHRTTDNAQGQHLAKVGDHEEVQAYADSRFSSAIDAMADALKASANPGRMALALRTALDMAIREAEMGR
jgi:hypothetical protein